MAAANWEFEMKTILLTSLATALALTPAAHAMKGRAGSATSVQDSAEYKRSESRKDGWSRGQRQADGQDAQTGQRQRGWRSEDDRRDDDDNRRGGWNGQASPQIPPSGSWNRGEERREAGHDDDRRNDNQRNRRGDDGSWRYRNDNDRRDDDGRWDRYGRDGRYDRRDNDRWDQGWRNDRRYDWREHRERYGSYYRPGRYYAPYRSDRYRRLNIGIHIGAPFYSSRYWIADPWRYRLPPAQGPYRWVRYYDDVLLVDVRRGYVVDVINNFFW
jgi:hypothetical protein